MITIEAIDQFENITNYPLQDYLLDYSAFLSDNRADILEYYRGEVNEPNIISFEALEDILSRSTELSNVIETSRSLFQTTGLWDLLESVDVMRTSLQTIDNSSKWVRSAISKNNFNPDPEIEMVLKNLQTLEKLAFNELGYNDGDKGWYDIALINNLTEEEYGTDGGVRIKTSFVNGASIRVNAVIDTIQGDNIYGKDIARNFAYEDNDVLTLNPNDTVKQSAEIMAGLRKNDNPEFPFEGIQVELVSGGNQATFTYPIILRQLFSTFQGDDTFRSLKIIKINNKEDITNIELQVDTVLGESLNESVIV